MTPDEISRLAVTATLCAFVLSVTVAMLVGLFDMRVDNAEIFKMITPPFSMAMGAFIGYLAGKDKRP